MDPIKLAERKAAREAQAQERTHGEAPASVAEDQDEVESLKGLVHGLQAQVDGLKSTTINGRTRRDRVKEHEATLREYSKDDKALGIVTRLHTVKEVRDRTENKKFYGVCSLDVLDPRTGNTTVYSDVDYLDFIENGKKVTAKVLEVKKDDRYETDQRKGGGGIGQLVHVNKDGVPTATEEFEFEVGYQDALYKLLIQDGEYEGLKIETTEKALNL